MFNNAFFCLTISSAKIKLRHPARQDGTCQILLQVIIERRADQPDAAGCYRVHLERFSGSYTWRSGGTSPPAPLQKRGEPDDQYTNLRTALVATFDGQRLRLSTGERCLVSE